MKTPECRTCKERVAQSGGDGTGCYVCRITLFPTPDEGLPMDECLDYEEDKR